MQLIQSVEPVELAQIERDWGQAPQQHHRLQVDHPFLTGDHQTLVSDRRRAEICYIMHRGRAQDGLLLHIKTFYPVGAFRLPTGGIHQGQGVVETLAREINEETGLTVGERADQVQVQRYLGLLSYEFHHAGLAARVSTLQPTVGWCRCRPMPRWSRKIPASRSAAGNGARLTR